MITDKKKIPKEKSLNATYNETNEWSTSTTVIKFTVQNGGAPITDELPGRGIVQQRIADQEKKIQNYEPKSNNSFNSVSITPSTSKISISSQSSAEKNQATQHVNPNKSQSQIPILSRNNSTSSFRDGSKNGSLKLISRSNTGASLFSNNSRTESPKIFKVDLAGRLVILSKNHPFLEKIKSGRKKIPQSYR